MSLDLMLDIDAVAETAYDFARRGDVNAALMTIADAAADIGCRDPARGEALSSHVLDAAAVAVGRLMNRSPRPRCRGRAVIVISALVTGEHPQNVVDLLRRAEGKDVALLVTNSRNSAGGPDQRSLKPDGIGARVSPHATMAMSMRWLQQQLSDLAPERTYLLINHDDAVAVAACQPELVGTLFFYHHRFNTFTLGAQTNHAVHVDCAATALHRCGKDRGDTAASLYWPLPSCDPVYHAAQQSLDQPFATACAGPIGDFEPIDMVEPLPYAINYPQTVATILATTRGRHFHLGWLSEGMIARINERVLQLGLDPANFIYLTGANDIAWHLSRYGIRLFLGGIPRTSLHILHAAMAAGLPLLLHSNYRSPLLTGEHDAYSGVRSWRTLSELANHLSASEETLLTREAQASRAAYRNIYAPSCFIAAVRDMKIGTLRPLPAKPCHHVDALRNYQDRHQAYRAVSSAKQPVPIPIDTIRHRWPDWIGAVVLQDQDLRIEPADGQLFRYILDGALAGPSWIELVGWAFGDSLITEILVEHAGHVTGTFLPNVARADVVTVHPDAPLMSGFRLAWSWRGELPADHRVMLRFQAGDRHLGNVSHHLTIERPVVAE